MSFCAKKEALCSPVMIPVFDSYRVQSGLRELCMCSIIPPFTLLPCYSRSPMAWHTSTCTCKRKRSFPRTVSDVPRLCLCNSPIVVHMEEGGDAARHDANDRSTTWSSNPLLQNTCCCNLSGRTCGARNSSSKLDCQFANWNCFSPPLGVIPKLLRAAPIE
eukprot:scpid41398/ scgid21377/ 